MNVETTDVDWKILLSRSMYRSTRLAHGGFCAGVTITQPTEVTQKACACTYGMLLKCNVADGG